MTESAFTALVLAASRGPEDPVARAEGVSHKALVDVAGTPMLLRVVRALSASRAVGRIAVGIEDPAVLATLGESGLIAAPTGNTPGASVLAGAAALDNPFPLLVTTGDHALLTPEMVDRFCTDALATGADVVAGLATKETILKDHPDTVRTYLKFRDGDYSGCNLFALLTPRGLKAPEFWGHIEHQRKRPWRLVRAFGAMSLVLFALRLLTLDGAFKRAGKRFGAKAAAVLLPWSEAAIDVDKPADLELVRKILGRDR
ncbi:MAG: NTP transferase domain-containing protein [Rhodospirillales bacterium]|nr:NTP transferase domain-containing protein [Rhodospirillales bacterium]